MRNLVFTIGFIILLAGCAVVIGVEEAVYSVANKIIKTTSNGVGTAIQLVIPDSDENKNEGNISKK